MLTRRRFLTIAATAAATPALASDIQEWQGRALGSEARIVLNRATADQAARIFRKIEETLLQVEGQFSLHRDSSLNRLNRDGWLAYPDGHLLEVFDLAHAVHLATGGIFDPTIQPLWLAIARGYDRNEAAALIGWERVRRSTSEIRLGYRMQLTFNGIAQGHAADRIAALMRAEGFGNVLVDMGEIAALGERPGGGGWRADITLPYGQSVARALLSDRALATSSPSGTLIGHGQPHIISPTGSAPLWRLASVSADRAALADALSTAFCLMDRSAINQALRQFPDARLEALA